MEFSSIDFCVTVSLMMCCAVQFSPFVSFEDNKGSYFEEILITLEFIFL